MKRFIINLMNRDSQAVDQITDWILIVSIIFVSICFWNGLFYLVFR